ncbi:hypothetical protein ACS0TY_015978 [Phlomoides rotata]
MVERGQSSSGNALHGNGSSSAQRFMVERGQSSSGNASHGNGSSSAQRFMVERGQSSSVRDIERPMAKYLAEKMFKEAEPQSSSPRGMARLMRLEGLNNLWNSKQKSKLPDGHRQNDVSFDIEPDWQPHGCLLYNRRMPTKKQQFSEVYDEPEASHFVNPRRSSEWRARSMPTVAGMGLIRQKIDTKRLSFGELIDPLELQNSRDMLMNYARRLDSANANRQGSSSSSQLERMDGLLLELQNRHGAHTSHRISHAPAEEKKKKKKKKDMFPRPIVFPRSELRNISTAEASSSSSYRSRGNIPDFRKMKEYPGVGTSEETSRRTRGSYHDAECSKPISHATRKLGRGVTRQLQDARDESEDEMYPGSRELMGGESLYNSCRSDFMSSGNSSIDEYRQGRHPSPRSVDREGTERLLESLKITRTYRDSELDDDPSVLREVIVIPDGRTRSNTFDYRGGDRPSAQLGTDNRSSVLGGASRSGPWNETQRSSSRSRSLPPLESRVHRRDASQGSTSRSRMPLPFPPIRISHNGSSLEATFEIQMEPDADDFSEQQLRSPMAERDDLSEDTVYDIMVDTQEIATLSSEHSSLHPRHSSEDDESSAADDQENFSVQGLRYGPPEEGSPSFNQLEAEPPFSESSNDADYASSTSGSEIPYAGDASFSFENFDRISAELNELRMRLQLPRLDSGANDGISSLPSSSAERWEDSYTLDVLIQSSFQDLGFDTLPIMWHYPDYPLNPALFDTLEEKYGDIAPELRSERLLLFDRINSALFEIFQKHVDLRPWLMPTLGLLSRRVREPTTDAVEDLISEETTRMQLIERVLLRDMQWEDPVEELASMGERIEELLLDDIIAELVCDLSGLMDVVYFIE